MPVIIALNHYDRWLSPLDPDPRDLLGPFPSEPMTMWPISTRGTSPRMMTLRSSNGPMSRLGLSRNKRARFSARLSNQLT